MALVVLPGGEQRSGKLGSWVYSHNAAGTYVRAKGSPVNPNTSRQVSVRSILQALSIAWTNDLTYAQRQAWINYALNVNMSQTYGWKYISGIAQYVRTNASRLQAGLARIDDAPTTFSLAPAEGSLGASGSEATQQVSITWPGAPLWAETTGSYMAVFVGLPQNPSREFFNGPWRFAGALLGDTTTPLTSPQLVTTPYPIAEGQRIWVRTRVGYDDGRLSFFGQADFLCAA